ncbi:MAG: ABC transporter substrate-binding protein [Acetobacteraceae bacterium]
MNCERPFLSMSRRGLLQGSAAGLAVIASGPAALGASPPEEGTPKRGGTLPFAIAAEPPTYDLHATATFAVLQRVAPHYSTLLQYKQHAYPQLVGDAAESWNSAPDQLTHTFKLRQGILFHDGTPLTSEDVKATYDRIRNPPDGVVSSRQESLAKVQSIETPDPLTVVFHMNEVDASFILEVCASPWNALYSAARLRKDPNFPAHNVMGSGPFKFVEHVAGSHWVGARFDGYFRPGRPYLDGFRAITMSRPATLSGMEGGQILGEFRGFTPAERDRLVRGMGKNANVQEDNFLLHSDISFNPQRKPFDDPRVRKALSLAIDRWGGGKALGRISFLQDVGGVMMPGGAWAATDEELAKLPGFGRDMAASRTEARRLLKEAGAENLKLTLLNRNIDPFTTAGVYAIDQWRQIGVSVEHQEIEMANYYASISGGGFDAVVDAYTDYEDDPTTGLVKFLSAEKWPVSSVKFTDPVLDDLYAKQARTVDKAARLQAVRQFEARVLEQSYVVPVLWWHRIVVLNASVKGWTMSPSDMIYQDLADIWLAPA